MDSVAKRKNYLFDVVGFFISSNSLEQISLLSTAKGAKRLIGAAKSDYYALAGESWKPLPNYDQFLLKYKVTGSGNPWIHISFNSAGNRGQVLTTFNNRVHETGLTQSA